MRIGVLSPVSHGTGASCISLLLALRLGQGTDRVCLTHTHPTDTSLRDIAGVGGNVDRTTTPSMIIRTFQSVSTMSEQEYAQYCAAVTRDVDLFTCTRAGDAICSDTDSRYLAKYIAEKFPHKHVVIDADNHSDAAMEEVIHCCDVVVFVIRVSRSEIVNIKQKIEQYKKAGILAGKRIAIVFNRYHDAVIKQKELSAMLGVKPAFIYCVDFNEYIVWASFNYKFPQFWQFVVKGDPRVAKIRSELDRLVQGIRHQKASLIAKSQEPRLLGVSHVELRSNDAVQQPSSLNSGGVDITVPESVVASNPDLSFAASDLLVKSESNNTEKPTPDISVATAGALTDVRQGSFAEQEDEQKALINSDEGKCDAALSGCIQIDEQGHSEEIRENSELLETVERKEKLISNEAGVASGEQSIKAVGEKASISAKNCLPAEVQATKALPIRTQTLQPQLIKMKSIQTQPVKTQDLQPMAANTQQPNSPVVKTALERVNKSKPLASLATVRKPFDASVKSVKETELVPIKLKKQADNTKLAAQHKKVTPLTPTPIKVKGGINSTAALGEG